MSSPYVPDTTAHNDLIELLGDLAKSPASVTYGLDSRWESFLELGLTAISVPEELGGSGGNFSDEVVVTCEAARHGISVPLAENLIASWLISQAGTEVTPTTRALVVCGGDAAADDGLVAVPWARVATEAVIAWPGSDRATLLTEPAISEGYWDLAGFPVDDVNVTLSGRRPLPDGSVCLMLGRLGVLRAAQLLGVATAVYELTLSYVNEREQFGKPLSTLPAVSASLAYMRTGTIQLERSIERAVLASVSGPDALLASAAACRTVAGSVASDLAARGHQLHGAMGITEEYGLGQHTRRLWSWRDADLPERSWSAILGALARSGGESAVWDMLTDVS